MYTTNVWTTRGESCWGWWWEELRYWDWYVYIYMYKVDNQKQPAV